MAHRKVKSRASLRCTFAAHRSIIPAAKVRVRSGRCRAMSRDLRASSEAFRASMDAFDESMAAGDPVPFVAAEDVKHWWNCWRRILNRFPQLKERKERTA